MAYDSPATRDARIDIATVLAAVWRRLPRILIVTLLLMGITFVLLMFAPRLYQSSASILVEPRSNAYVRASNEQVATPPPMRAWCRARSNSSSRATRC